MEFRDKIEIAVRPFVEALRQKLAKLPTLEVLNHYQLRIHLAGPGKDNLPDGFYFKWRYLWALLLSQSFVGENDYDESQLNELDALIEKIFGVYEVGALYEPERFPRSEEEFLTRLGLALKVRERDVLAFPEQIQKWALRRLEPFDESYFGPKFGVSFSELSNWFNGLISKTEDRLNVVVNDLGSILEDGESLRKQVVQGELDLAGARRRALDLKIRERLEVNARLGHGVATYCRDDLRCGIPVPSLEAIIDLLGVRPGGIERECLFPHDENPLGYKAFVILPDETFYLLDPANVHWIAARTFEREILATKRLRDPYLKKRDRATERWVSENMKEVFSEGAVYTNYYLEKNSYEKDILVRFRDTIVLIECKNTRVRPFKGTYGDLLKFREDFQNSVQYGYEQALEVKRRILGSEEVTFFDEDGRPYFSVRREEVKRFYLLCVTVTPRGPFGTDLSYELKKPSDEPFPLAVNLLDFDTICKHLGRPEQFLSYLKAREGLHGHVKTGDELNYAGYFLKYGNLDFGDGTMVADDFSAVFDRAWYRQKGVDVHEPEGPPAPATVTRAGNRVCFEYAGRKEVLRVPPEWVERASGSRTVPMRGYERNKPCPCGSGRKFKHCHGL